MVKLFLWFLALGWGYLTYHLTTTPNLVVAPENFLNFILMNGAHFGFFGVQAVLLYLAINKDNRVIKLLTILIVSAFGYAIEILQKTIPGRSYDLVDWSLDTLGAIIFLYLLSRYSQTLRKYLHI